MQCASPYRVYNDGFPSGLDVPCGNCTACRITRSSVWAQRIVHELNYHESSVFATLTYNNENVPENYSLRKRDLQLFWKRLRKLLGKRRIKYYACGEYGDKYGRPHYHAIIFGLSLNEVHTVERCWPFGYCHFGSVTHDSAQYVTGYVTKKLTGKLAEQNYAGTGREAPFNTMSQGIGLQYAMDNADFIKDKKYLTMRGSKVPIPRYYRKKLGMGMDDFAQYFLEKEMSDIKYHYKRGACTASNIVDFYLHPDFPAIASVQDAVNNSRRIMELTLKAKIRNKSKNIF